MVSRVCIVGSRGVGKSSIAARIDDVAFSSQKKGYGTLFVSCKVVVCEKSLNLEIIDVSGEERLICMGPIYYKEAKAALCVFDLTSAESFQALAVWIESVRNNGSDECLLIVLGNKLDLEEIRQISHDSGEKYAKSIGARYFEVSAASGTGLIKVLIYLSKHILLWKDCSSTYAAKRAIVSNSIEYISPRTENKKGRFFFN